MGVVLLEYAIHGDTGMAMAFDSESQAREYVNRLRECHTVKRIHHDGDVDDYLITFRDHGTAKLHICSAERPVSYYLLRFNCGVYQETRRFHTRRQAIRYVEDYLDRLGYDPDTGENETGTWKVRGEGVDVRFILRIGPSDLLADDDGKSVTYRRILGVTKNATESDIRQAYRKRAKNAHPDAGGSADEFERVQAAYEYLMANLDDDANDGFDIKQITQLPFSVDLYYFLDVVKDEMDQKTIEEVSTAVRGEALGLAGKGLVMAIAGGVLTAISYNSASNGGTYIVFTGLIAVGIINFCRAIWYVLASRHNAKKFIKRANDDEQLRSMR